MGQLGVLEVDHLGLEPLLRPLLGQLLGELGCCPRLRAEVDAHPPQGDCFFLGRGLSLGGLGDLRGWLRLAEEVEDEEEDCECDGHVGQHAQLKVRIISPPEKG